MSLSLINMHRFFELTVLWHRKGVHFEGFIVGYLVGSNAGSFHNYLMVTNVDS